MTTSESTKGMTAEEAVEELRQLIAYALPTKSAGAEIKPKELALLQAYETSEQILSLLKADRTALAKRLRIFLINVGEEWLAHNYSFGDAGLLKAWEYAEQGKAIGYKKLSDELESKSEMR